MKTDFFTTHSWKKTSLGTDIPLHASAPLASLKNQKPILLMGGIHGDEPEGVELAKQTLHWLQNTVEEVVPWIVVPCLNVDGFAKQTRVNGRGVDINRNYPSKDWSPAFEKERYFPGASAASEIESQGVVELIETYQPRLVIHCHSWNPMIVCTGSTGLRDAVRLGECSGYKVVDDIGYPTPGSLSSYGWHDLQVSVICIEEQEGIDRSTIWPRFKRGMLEIFTDLSDRSRL